MKIKSFVGVEQFLHDCQTRKTYPNQPMSIKKNNNAIVGFHEILLQIYGMNEIASGQNVVFLILENVNCMCVYANF